MRDYRPIDCDLHDYLEIACLRGYRLAIELIDGERIDAIAVTTRTAASKEEFLVIERDGARSEIRLDRLAAIAPLDAGASFGRVVLASGK